MSYSVYGYVYDENGDPVEGVTVLPYFMKKDSGSDDSKWSDEKYETDSNGYYSYSPEDSCLLGSEGVCKKGVDYFYCTYMLGGEENIDSLDLTDAMFHSHKIPNDDDLQIDITLLAKLNPIIDSHSFPDAILTQHEYSMSEVSYCDTSWHSADKGEDRSQKLIYDLVDIFDGHQLIDTVYTWDEVDDREIDNNSSDSYTFTTADDYTLKIKVREKWNTYTQVTKDIRIKYNEPNVDFDWTPVQTNDWDGSKIKGQEEITFHNNTTDLDDRTKDNYTFKWEIEDANQDDSDNSDTYADKDVDFEPTKKFQSEGTKTIKLTCYWNDGFDDQEVSISKEINIYPFTILPEFEFNNPIDRGIEVVLTDKTDDPDEVFSKLVFHVDDYYEKYNPDNPNYGDDTTDNAADSDDLNLGDEFKHNFQAKDNHLLRLTVTYSDGWKDVDSVLEYTLNPDEHILEANISSDPEGLLYYGKNEVTWKNSSTTANGDAANRQIDADWEWNDKDGDDDHITTRSGEDWDSDQKFTFQYPSRKPFSAVDGDTDYNYNKNVSINVRYDNGWNDVTRNSYNINVEASPYEIQGSISYECNVDNYTH